MADAAFIFEGTVVRTVEYFNKDSSRLYLTSIVKLNRSVKGDLANNGTVQVVYREPAVESVEKDPKTGELTIGLPVPPKDGVADTQGMIVPRNKSVVFSAGPCRLPLPRSRNDSPRAAPTNWKSLDWPFLSLRTVPFSLMWAEILKIPTRCTAT